MNNNPVRYNDPSGNFAIPVVATAILFHPVTALLVSAIILTTAHNVLPGREGRTAAVANVIETVEVGLEKISQAVTSDRHRKQNKRDKEIDQIIYELQNPVIGGGSPDNFEPIGNPCDSPIECAIAVAVIGSTIVSAATNGGHGQDESNSHGNFSAQQPNDILQPDTPSIGPSPNSCTLPYTVPMIKAVPPASIIPPNRRPSRNEEGFRNLMY
jgi:hypothetical protein